MKHKEAPSMNVRHDFRHDITVMVVRLAACCVLALTGCSEPINSQTPDDVPAPVVMRPDAWEPPTLTEAAVLADRILRRENDSLLIDAADRRELADEIALALSRIRDAYPAMADINTRAPYAFGELLLTLETWLFEAVASSLEDQTESVVLRTGHVEFDALNERLGLSVIADMFPSFGAVIFYFNEYLNVPAAAATYEAMEGIEFAEPNVQVGDGSDIDMAKSEGRWYVVVRHAWGDCPAGCINEELHFFIVNGTDVEQVDRAQAMERTEFSELVMNRGW
jgi:hypothetical protein